MTDTIDYQQPRQVTSQIVQLKRSQCFVPPCIRWLLVTHILGREDSKEATVIFQCDSHLRQHRLTTQHSTSHSLTETQESQTF